MEISHDVIHIFDEPQAKHRVRNKAKQDPARNSPSSVLLLRQSGLLSCSKPPRVGALWTRLGNMIFGTLYMLYINHLCASPFC